ncbi:hypothetical protein [Haloplanus halophilus]|uniref:hypothetical protein n=1 Tax=Haloplanus halophilus TaxID=2949993 RepID=UPI002040D794|nr:hypothetical protein [Haloplanus sp. GDY1]
MSVRNWLRRVDWLWMTIGGFYLVAYLFWYVPALEALPESVRDPPSPYPWHWTLDFAATGVAGGALLFLGFDRATELTTPRNDDDR